jgi:nicotinamidase-related amidase
MKQTALLIVDVQIGIFERSNPVYNEEYLITKINELEAFARTNDIPIVYIQHESSGFLKKGSQGWQLHPGLHPNDADLFIEKKEGNSFFETPLQALLAERKINTVLVCGLLSGLCVQRTCLGAIELGYDTILVADAHSNMSKKNPRLTIDKVNKTSARAGAKVISVEKVLEMSFL